jgi:hypothetical protein
VAGLDVAINANSGMNRRTERRPIFTANAEEFGNSFARYSRRKHENGGNMSKFDELEQFLDSIQARRRAVNDELIAAKGERERLVSRAAEATVLGDEPAEAAALHELSKADERIEELQRKSDALSKGPSLAAEKLKKLAEGAWDETVSALDDVNAAWASAFERLQKLRTDTLAVIEELGGLYGRGSWFQSKLRQIKENSGYRGPGRPFAADQYIPNPENRDGFGALAISNHEVFGAFRAGRSKAFERR